MKSENPFDKKLELLRANRDTPQEFVDAAAFVVDSMDLAAAAAESLFDEARPEVVIALYDRFLQHWQSSKEAGRNPLRP
jgi:hypothetical protein